MIKPPLHTVGFSSSFCMSYYIINAGTNSKIQGVNLAKPYLNLFPAPSFFTVKSSITEYFKISSKDHVLTGKTKIFTEFCTQKLPYRYLK